ncbi:hypothetical protein BC834DRAFT_863744 [Gloeopeniophorella convolvens]|nr:hypothetical protein BC834DRAFT_863744 [Gloeopeniophorella convolvens]
MAPLAGRPPFATDEPDSVFADPQPQRIYRQPPKDNPDARSSAYNHYDGYLSHGGPDDSDDGYHNKHAALAAAIQPTPQQMPVPLAAPKPGYAAPIAALSMPQPSPSPDSSREASQFPPGLGPADQYGAPRMPPNALRAPPPPVAPISVPSTPHPLPPTMTPILPVFARPAKTPEATDVKWGPEPIMRGGSEEKLLPRRGEKGDDFWRRFSMVAREENKKPTAQKQSTWLRKTQNGSSRLSLWVWVIGLILLACVGLGIGVGWYVSHKSPSHQDPTALGGGANKGIVTTTSGVLIGTGTGAHLSPHVTPTNTVLRREAMPDPSPTPAPGAPIHVMHIPHPPHGIKHDPARAHAHVRNQRSHINRTFD